MNCKYPKGSRSYKCCIECDSKYMCEDSTLKQPDIPMPEVSQPEVVFPSASQANKLTKENIQNRYTKELKNIIEMINEAISDGRFVIKGTRVLAPGTVERLEKLGYMVETGLHKTSYDNQTTPFYYISWLIKGE